MSSLNCGVTQSAANTLRRRSAVVIIAAILIFSSGCRGLEKHILYHPDCYPEKWNEPLDSELVGFSLEDAYFNSADGTALHGWYVQPDDWQPDRVVLFAHGRSGNISRTKSNLFEFAIRNRAAVLVFDYRGYGKSEGCPSESGLYEDASAARVWLAARTGIRNCDVILMGRSLGSAVVIDLAAREGAKALIVECGFTSFPDVVRHHSRNILTGRNVTSTFDSVSKIGAYSGPVLISHGVKDKLIPYSHGMSLALACNSASEVQLIQHPGGHQSPPDEVFRIALKDFLERL